MTHNKPSTRQILWQFIRLASISGAIFILSLVMVLGALGWIYRDRVKELFLEDINRRLRTEISVENIQLNLLSSFPMASLRFNDVIILETETGEGPDRKVLLKARSIHLEFNLHDILRKDYTVKRISLSDGYFSPSINKDGAPNYLFWDHSPADDTTGFRFDLQSLQLNRLAFLFAHHRDGHHVSADIDNLLLRGDPGSGSMAVSAKGKMHVNTLQIGNTVIPGDKPLEMDLMMTVSQEHGLLLHESALTWNSHHFFVDGTFAGQEDGLWAEAQVSGKRIDPGKLLGDLPPSWSKSFTQYHPAGTADFDASISGVLNNKGMPYISSTFMLEHGGLRHPGSGNDVSIDVIRGSYTNGSRQSAITSRVRIDHVKARINKGEISGSASIHNFRQPEISFQLTAGITAKDLLEWQEIGPVTKADGTITMEVVFSGNMNEDMRFTGQGLMAAQLSGHVRFEDVDFILHNNHLLPYRNFHGMMAFHNNRLEIEYLSGTAGESDFLFSGYMKNVLPYLFLPDEQLFISAGLQSQNINLDQLLQDSKTVSESDTIYHLRFPERLRLQLDAGIESLRFRRFEASALTGKTRLEDQRLSADHLIFNTMDGKVHLQGLIDGRQEDVVLMHCNAWLSAVDIHQLFYQTGNFGQQGIIDENLFGRVTADMFFSAEWSPRLNIDWGSMETTANLRIEDGRLINYNPMIALGSFLRAGDLSNVSFSTLENEIHIKNRRVMIPEMEISSSALNLQLSGEHTFENEIDYRLQVLLSDILGRNHRERRNPQEQYGEIIDDGLGRTTLFLRLTGTTMDPVFRYDHQGVREKIREDLRQERETLLSILRDEFSFLRRHPADTTATEPGEREQERQRLQKQEEGEFIIEWEDF